MTLSGSEAVYGFVGWLTSNDRFESPEDNPLFGPTQDAAPWADLIDEFCNANGLDEPRPDWHKLLKHPE